MIKVELSEAERAAIISKRDEYYARLSAIIPDFYAQKLGIQKSERYWKLILYRFFAPLLEYYIACEYLKQHSDFDDFSKGPTKTPFLDRQFEEYSYRAIYDLDEPFDINALEANDEMPVVSSGIKTKVKRILFKLRLTLQASKPKLLLSSEFMPEIWPGLFPELKPLTLVFSVESPRETQLNPDMRQAFHSFLMEEGHFEQAFANCLTKLYPMDYLENLDHNYDLISKVPMAKNVRLVLFGWIPDMLRRLYVGELIENSEDCKLSIIQHGGTFGEYDHSIWEAMEKDLSDQFFSWSQKEYDEKVIPTIPTRLLKFRKSYEKRKMQNAVPGRYDVLIVDGLRYKTIGFHDLLGLRSKEEDIFNFLKNHKDGTGEGVLLRVYDRRGIVMEDYIPRIEKAFPKLTIHTQNNSLIDDMLMCKDLYVNYMYSTFRWEANFVGRRVELLSDKLK